MPAVRPEMYCGVRVDDWTASAPAGAAIRNVNAKFALRAAAPVCAGAFAAGATAACEPPEHADNTKIAEIDTVQVASDRIFTLGLLFGSGVPSENRVGGGDADRDGDALNRLQ